MAGEPSNPAQHVRGIVKQMDTIIAVNCQLKCVQCGEIEIIVRGRGVVASMRMSLLRTRKHCLNRRRVGQKIR